MEKNTKMDIKWSNDNKIEESEVLKTMECLRRRLVAERQESLLAKEEAELMGKRSTELENQITEQIQMKTKAEKKLKLLRKKLESLNLSSAKVNSEPSTSSEIRDEDESKTLTESSALRRNKKAVDEISQSKNENPNARSSPSSRSCTASEINSDEPSKVGNGGEEFDSEENPLAIVAVNSPEKEETGELKAAMDEKMIIEVLNDLKEARERILRSMRSVDEESWPNLNINGPDRKPISPAHLTMTNH